MYLELDGQGPRYLQLIRALKTAILAGRIPPGERLPATRSLARELGISRNTVLVAYEQIVAEGFAEGRVGAGTYVADLGESPPREKAAGTANARRMERAPPQSRFAGRARGTDFSHYTHAHAGLRYDLQYGAPLLNPAIANAWRRELTRAAGSRSLDYPGPRGLRALREAIAAYLGRRRGLQVHRSEVLVVSGAQQAFDLAARVLLDEGDGVVIEEPGYFGMREVMHAHGVRIHAVPVDREGLKCAGLPGEGVRLVCVTPSHQFPSGTLLSLPRRLELLRYASRHGAWIIEDDYDGEFRYDAKPIAALRALDDADRVIYVGSFSKMLFPALRLGYMVLPDALREDFVSAKRLADFGCPAIEQAALARFMESPGFDRHLRNASSTLRARRRALLQGLEEHAGDHVEVVDAPAGMHTVVWLRDYSFDDCERLIMEARSVGVGLYPIEPHYLGKPERPGLLLGYAGLAPEDITLAMQLFGECLERLRPHRRRAAMPGAVAQRMASSAREKSDL